MSKSLIDVLVIEDNPSDVLFLREHLNRDTLSEFHMVAAETLGEGLAQAQPNRFNVILVDLGLPDSQGLETFRRVHAHIQDTPIIVCSGFWDEQVAIEAVRLGAQDYLVKDFGAWEFAARSLRYAIERFKLVHSLQASEQRYRLLVDNINDAVVSTDLNYNVSSWNPAAERMYGWSESETLGKPVQNFMRPEYVTRPLDQVEQILIEQGAWSDEVIHHRRDGTPFPVLAAGSQIIDEAGKVLGYVAINHDITERKQAEEKLRESEEKYRRLSEDLEERVRQATAEVQDLYNNAPSGYHSLDGQGNLIYINDTELKWLGRTHEQVIGHSFAEFIAPHQAEQFYQQHLAVIKAGKPIQDLEYDLVSSNGSTMPILLKAMPVMDAAGNFVMSRATLVDITERKQAEQAILFSRDQLDLANRELARASKLKDEFLANMSHELRTPLNAILGLSQSLSEQIVGPLNERQLEAIGIVESSGRHLLALINDILDLSKIEAGNMTLNLEPMAVNSVCQASLIFIKQIAHKKRVQVSSQFDPAVEWIQADERRLKQMLVNLLTNAVKFTPSGGKVDLTVTGSCEKNTVQFSVRDTGIGIAPEDLDKLFKPFMQVDSSMTRQFEGTGLGLSLVMRTAELHGGSVLVESELGRGSVFTIVLPWDETMQKYSQVLSGTLSAAVTVPAQTLATSQSAVARGPLILIAEDNEANITTLSMYLQAKGYRLIVAKHGGEAVDLARSEQPALILMDVQMPVLDGLEATRRLRRESDPRIAGIPVIALTALAMPGDRERALAAGANEYMTKPVALVNLVNLIKKFIEDA